MHRTPFLLSLLLLLVLLVAPPSSARTRPGGMEKYETRYYVLHTDLDVDQAREAAIRITKMAEEYAKRTNDFGGGSVRKKMPFYLFADEEDYYATGAPRASSGRFNGTSLLAIAQDFGPKTWHIVQHEGFHQFADAVINAHLPPWVNEGLAEYFGEAIFTGDGYVTGAIPQWRLERVRKRFQSNEFKSLREMMSLPISAWNTELTLANYDQAWAMVQFLAHGENGRYQKAFSAFLGMLGRGVGWQIAWQRTFGETRGFEERWRAWWTTLPDHPTRDVYARAVVATLTGYLARAFSQGQTFESLDAFAAAAAAAAEAESIKHHPDDWLPPRLLKEALADAQKLTVAGAKFQLVTPTGKPPHMQCALADGTTVEGRFLVRQGRVASVTTSTK